MQLRNSTDFSDAFLRRMVSWACKQIPLPVRYLKRATFRKTKTTYREVAYSGLGGGRSIIVRIGPATAFPTPEFVRNQVKNPAFADRIEALVSVTVHECYHCRQSKDNAWGDGTNFSEPAALQAEKTALAIFRENRESLLAEWSKPITEKAHAVIPISEKRQAKAVADLTRWERKLSLAKSKVRKYAARVRYYEKKAATKQE